MELFRYFLKERPPMPGAIPNRGLMDVCAFDRKLYTPEIGGYAWGYVDYMEPLTAAQIEEYELTEPIEK